MPANGPRRRGLLQSLDVDGHDLAGTEQGAIRAIQDALRGDGTTTHLVLVQQRNDAGETQFAHAVRIGAVFEQDAKSVALKGFGLDNRARHGQVGVGLLEAFDVDNCAGPNTVRVPRDAVHQCGWT